MEEECRECHLNLFGIPTLIIADDPHLLGTARAAHADWLADCPAATPEIILRLARGNAPSDEVSPTITVDGSRLTLDDGGITGWADAATREAACVVPVGLIGDPARLAETVTDTLLLFIATRNGRVPVHASGIMIGATAVLLAGASGAGKSTLALAARDRGLDVLSDDTVYVETQPLRIWGWPRPIHVLAADAPAGDHEIRVRAGRAKHAIPINDRPVPVAGRAALVVLGRGDVVELDRLDPTAAMARLERLEPGFDLLPDQSRATIALLSAGGAWRLRLSDDPHAAIDLLIETFA